MKKVGQRIFNIVVSLLMVLALWPTAVTDINAETSNNLADFAKSAEVKNATKNSDGSYTVLPYTSYTFVLHCQENNTPGGLQFPQTSNATLEYKIPDGLILDSESLSGTMDIPFTIGQKAYDITDCKWEITRDSNGKYKYVIHLNTTDTTTWNAFNSSSNATFDLNLTAQVAKSTDIKWTDNVITKIVTDNSKANLAVSKTGSYDASRNLVNYDVTITSTGYNSNVVVNDAVQGTALTYNGDAYLVNASNYKNQGTLTTDGNGFKYVVSSMGDGETRTIHYTAAVDIKKLSGDGTLSGGTLNFGTKGETENTVTYSSNEKPKNDPVTHDLTNQISYASLNKSAGNVTANGTTSTIPWTVTYNSEANVSMAGSTLTDTIDAASQGFMKYSGAGIHIVKKTKSGTTVETYDVAWSKLSSKSDSKWVYQIPTSDTEAFSYTITYETQVDTSTFVDTKNVKNTINDNKGRASSGSKDITPSQDQQIAVSKKATAVNSSKDITWESTITVPANGLTKATVVDTYPTESNGYYQDTLSGNVTVSGVLTDSTGKEIEYYTIDTSDSKKVTVEFFQDAAHQVYGLKGTGSSRTIKITLTTSDDQKWISAAASQSYLKKHVNNVSFTGNGVTKTDSAEAYPGNTIFTKNCVDSNGKVTSEPCGTASDGMQYYKYNVVFSNMSGDFDITDQFDTSKLELYGNIRDQYNNKPIWDANVLYSGDQYSCSKYEGEVTYDVTDTGITFHVKSSQLSAGPGSYYKLVYYLKVKTSAVDELNKDSIKASDKVVKLNNKATINNQTQSVDVDYKYAGITKDVLTNNNNVVLQDGKILNYTLTVNPNALNMSDGNTLTVTDISSDNLSLLYTSIEIYSVNTATQAETLINSQCTYDVHGSTATFTIPDETKVIIRYQSAINTSKVGDIEITNDAKVTGFEDNTDSKVNYKGASSASASNEEIYILKCKKDDMSTVLAGAKFALSVYSDTEGKYVPVTDQKGSNAGKQAVFTTGSDGIARVIGDDSQVGWTLNSYGDSAKFKLTEIEAPEGYVIDGTGEYYFTFADVADYSKNEYFNGDTIKVYNDVKPATTSLKVAKVWSDSNNQDGKRTASVTFQLQKTVDGKTSDVDQTVTLNADNNWAGSFTDLAQYEDGKAITYSAKETSELPEGYTAAGEYDKATNTYTITNSYTPEITSAKVTKTWDDNNNQYNVRPTNVTFQLQKTVDGKTSDVEDKTVVLNDENAWTYTFKDLPKYEGGKEITYSAVETSTDKNYTSEANGLTVKNTLITGKLVIKKTFAGTEIPDTAKNKLNFKVTGPNNYEKTISYAEFTNGEYTLDYILAGDYKVEEVNNVVDGYRAVVTYTVNGKTGQTASVDANTTPVFAITNTYVETPKTPTTPTPTPDRPTTPTTPDRPTTPNTGDQTNLPMAAAGMLFGTMAAMFVVFFKRKYSD